MVNIGLLHGSFGVHGGIKASLEDGLVPYLESKEINFLFVDIDGDFVPMRLSRMDVNSELILFFTKVSTPEQAKALSGKNIYLPIKDLPSEFQPERDDIPSIDELSSYTLVIEDQDTHYPIIDIKEYPMQVLLVLQINNKEVLIPFVDDYIKDINTEEQLIKMSLPTGLLDL